jgi:hypothetical protein
MLHSWAQLAEKFLICCSNVNDADGSSVLLRSKGSRDSGSFALPKSFDRPLAKIVPPHSFTG